MRSHAFGPFGLDPAERLLLRGGQPVALTPKAFDLLVYLVERHGRLVEKQELMAALWPDAVVEEANLADRPHWSGEGQQIVFRSGRRMMAVDVTTGLSFAAGKPRVLFEGDFEPGGTTTPNYDLTADGRRLLMIKPAPPSPAPSRLVVVENWFSELREKLGP